MTNKGYTIMHTVIHANVIGAVLAPKGMENLPKEKRAFEWRVLVRPLIEEVAEHEEFPVNDVKRVVKELGAYCIDAGLAFKIER